MSVPNFRTMSDFPLYVRNFVEEVAYCPDCGLFQDHENTTCEQCDGELELRSEINEFEAEYVCSTITDRLHEANRTLLFYKISLQDGHYTGVQFYVEEEHNPNDYDNGECRYYFEMYRSVAIRRYDSESNKVDKILRMLASEYGFQKVFCHAIFSNGEAIYEIADNTPRSKILQAVCCG